MVGSRSSYVRITKAGAITGACFVFGGAFLYFDLNATIAVLLLGYGVLRVISGVPSARLLANSHLVDAVSETRVSTEITIGLNLESIIQHKSVEELYSRLKKLDKLPEQLDLFHFRSTLLDGFRNMAEL